MLILPRPLHRLSFGLVVLSIGINSPAQPSEPAPLVLPTMEVTGSRLGRPINEGPAIVAVIDRAEIERRAPGNLSELLRELPDLTVTSITENVAINNTHGTTAVELRGLGAGNTLVLVDGRRTTVSANAFDGTVFVDINRYPPGLIERVEILKGGASAVYGADAVAGVINLVTRRRPSGGEAFVSYGNAFDTDAAETHGSFVVGATRGRLGLTARATFFERNALYSRDRYFSRTANLIPRFVAADPYYANLPAAQLAGYDGRSLTSPYARISLAGGQINGQSGVNIPGLATGAPITALPGTGGTTAGTLASVTPNFTSPFTGVTGGLFNSAAAGSFVAPAITRGDFNAHNLYDFNDTFTLVPSTTRVGAGLRLEYETAGGSAFFAELAGQKIRSHTEFLPVGVSGLVPRTNPYNPFGVDVNVAWRLVQAGTRSARVVNDNYFFLAGIRGAAASAIRWEAAVNYSHDAFTDRTANWLSASRTMAALASSGSGALNPFGGPQFANDPALLDSLRRTVESTGSASLLSLDVQAARDLLALPGGPLRLAVYAEHRREAFGFGFDPFSLTGDILGLGLLPDPSDWTRNVRALAAEVRAPLLPPAGTGGIPRLALELSARTEQADGGFKSGIRPTLGLILVPTPGWTVRATWAHTFRAPSLPQLFSPQSEGYYNSVLDPRRPQALTGDPYDGPNVSRLVRSGGNPDLNPETGRVLQVALNWSPTQGVLKGLTAEVNWFRYDLENIISGVGPSYVLENELGGLGDLVHRDSGTETYFNTTGAPINLLTGPAGELTALAPGQSATVPGRLQRIDSYIVNLSRRRLVGTDFSLRYSREIAHTGQWTVGGMVTYTDESSYAYDQQSPLVDNTGATAQPYWRGRGLLTWSRGAWNASSTLQYTPGTGKLEVQGSHFKPYRVVNLQVGYRCPAGSWLKGSTVSLGIDDLFEAEPPLINDPPIGYSYSNVSRPQGRFWRVSLRREW